jgi:hypothetical protein
MLAFIKMTMVCANYVASFNLNRILVIVRVYNVLKIAWEFQTKYTVSVLQGMNKDNKILLCALRVNQEQ